MLKVAILGFELIGNIYVTHLGELKRKNRNFLTCKIRKGFGSFGMKKTSKDPQRTLGWGHGQPLARIGPIKLPRMYKLGSFPFKIMLVSL